MKKLIVLSALTLSLAGCADAHRSYPAIVVEERPIPSYYYERAPIIVPVDRGYLPPPRYDEHRQVEERHMPTPAPRPYNLEQRPQTRHTCDPHRDHECKAVR